MKKLTAHTAGSWRDTSSPAAGIEPTIAALGKSYFLVKVAGAQSQALEDILAATVGQIITHARILSPSALSFFPESAQARRGAPEPPVMEDLLLPPSVPDAHMADASIECIAVPNFKAAEVLRSKLQMVMPEMLIEYSERQLPSTTCLVLKGLPAAVKLEAWCDELVTRLSIKPSYVRLGRTERGAPRSGLIFLKYRNRVLCDMARLELERISVGGRLLKPELKKVIDDPSTAPKTCTPGEALQTATFMHHINTLLKNPDYDALTYNVRMLTRDDLKVLKSVAQICDPCLIVDVSVTHVTVKKKTLGSSATKGSGISPPMSAMRTPPFGAQRTPPLAPRTEPEGLTFRGIKHWKDQRAPVAASKQLAFVRTSGPGEGGSFPAGRGRPVPE